MSGPVARFRTLTHLISLLLLISTYAKIGHAEALSLDVLITNLANHHGNFTSLSFDASYRYIQLDPESQQPMRESRQVAFVYVDSATDSFKRVLEVYRPKPDKPDEFYTYMRNHNLWTGGIGYNWGGPREDRPATISSLGKAIVNSVSVAAGGELLQGTIASQKPLREVLSENTTFSSVQNKQNVGGNPCYVVTSTGVHGDYRIWVDARDGCSIRKCVIRKTADSFSIAGKPLGEYGISKRLFVYENVSLEEINGVCIPTAATIRKETVYSDGTEDIWLTEVKIDNVEFAPDFSGVFEPNIPDGTQVANLDTPGIMYTWKEGAPSPTMQAEELDALLESSVEFVEQAPLPQNSRAHTGDEGMGQEMQPRRKASIVVFALSIFLAAAVLCFGFLSLRRRLRR